MSEQHNILTPDAPDRNRAIVACGLLIDSLTERQPSLPEIKDRLYQLSKHCRAAIAEIRQAEALANGVRFTAINEYLDLGF